MVDASMAGGYDARRAVLNVLRYILAVATGLVACNAVSGVDDYNFETTGAGAAGTGATAGSATGAGGNTGGVGAVGGGVAGGSRCASPDKLCDGICVSSQDPLYGCNSSGCNPCEDDESCCGGCQKTAFNPKSCGGCDNECDEDEYCNGGDCECRPDLVLQGNACVDPLTDPSVCGSDGPCGGGTPKCDNGTCVAACSGGLTDCSGACVDTDGDALHCGSCTEVCDTDKVCAGGSCREYRAEPECNRCPCDECAGDYDQCCDWPGASLVICVKDTSSCP